MGVSASSASASWTVSIAASSRASVSSALPTVAALAGDKVETILKVYAHEYDRARRGAELRKRVAAANTAAQ